MMRRADIRDIAEELNSRALNHPIGELQSLRAKLHGKHPRTNKIFHPQTIKDEKKYAFHDGGRRELQFNIGFRFPGDEQNLRYGVAFSFKRDRNLHDPQELLPKVGRFNEFFKLGPDPYKDMHMWERRGTEQGKGGLPGRIQWHPAVDFIFLGKCTPSDQIDYEEILGTFDRLLPLYIYVEDNAASALARKDFRQPFHFRPTKPNRATSAVSNRRQGEVDVNLRQNKIQQVLYKSLVKKYGSENVGCEHPSGGGGTIDVVFRLHDGFLFHEIKTEETARECIRKAMPQLFEYSYWPGAQEAERLIIVGEPALDGESKQYLETLRRKFRLPVEYQQIKLKY